MKHIADVYKTYQKYNSPEAPKEVPPRVREIVTNLQSKVATLPEAQRAEFQTRIDDIISKAQDKDMNNKLSALAVEAGKRVAGMAGGALLGPAGGVVSGAVAQYYATEFENAAKKESGVIRPAEKIAGRRRAKRSSSKKENSPSMEAAKTAAKSTVSSTVSSAVGGVGGIARSVWEGVKSLWSR